eukprot:TRINITY_DN49958_c0_g1_i1.p1 TRINITY_DN49958_c0_g1~~TRINITY_DN49958_c0_g1_i1.p1  ORF type:complete len:860 (+),score=192.23 TRINITY_DN49958_c0_g1_i1:86-2665(+)
MSGRDPPPTVMKVAKAPQKKSGPNLKSVSFAEAAAAGGPAHRAGAPQVVVARPSPATPNTPGTGTPNTPGAPGQRPFPRPVPRTRPVTAQEDRERLLKRGRWRCTICRATNPLICHYCKRVGCRGTHVLPGGTTHFAGNQEYVEDQGSDDEVSSGDSYVPSERPATGLFTGAAAGGSTSSFSDSSDVGVGHHEEALSVFCADFVGDDGQGMHLNDHDSVQCDSLAGSIESAQSDAFQLEPEAWQLPAVEDSTPGWSHEESPHLHDLPCEVVVDGLLPERGSDQEDDEEGEPDGDDEYSHEDFRAGVNFLWNLWGGYNIFAVQQCTPVRRGCPRFRVIFTDHSLAFHVCLMYDKTVVGDYFEHEPPPEGVDVYSKLRVRLSDRWYTESAAIITNYPMQVAVRNFVEMLDERVAGGWLAAVPTRLTAIPNITLGGEWIQPRDKIGRKESAAELERGTCFMQFRDLQQAVVCARQLQGTHLRTEELRVSLRGELPTVPRILGMEPDWCHKQWLKAEAEASGDRLSWAASDRGAPAVDLTPGCIVSLNLLKIPESEDAACSFKHRLLRLAAAQDAASDTDPRSWPGVVLRLHSRDPGRVLLKLKHAVRLEWVRTAWLSLRERPATTAAIPRVPVPPMDGVVGPAPPQFCGRVATPFAVSIIGARGPGAPLQLLHNVAAAAGAPVQVGDMRTSVSAGGHLVEFCVRPVAPATLAPALQEHNGSCPPEGCQWDSIAVLVVPPCNTKEQNAEISKMLRELPDGSLGRDFDLVVAAALEPGEAAGEGEPDPGPRRLRLSNREGSARAFCEEVVKQIATKCERFSIKLTSDAPRPWLAWSKVDVAAAAAAFQLEDAQGVKVQLCKRRR